MLLPWSFFVHGTQTWTLQRLLSSQSLITLLARSNILGGGGQQYGSNDRYLRWGSNHYPLHIEANAILLRLGSAALPLLQGGHWSEPKPASQAAAVLDHRTHLYKWWSIHMSYTSKNNNLNKSGNPCMPLKNLFFVVVTKPFIFLGNTKDIHLDNKMSQFSYSHF